jgi:hypothetical protein
LHKKVVALLDIFDESENAGQISIYLIRIIREIRSELPVNASAQTFGLALVPLLHKKLVLTATQELLDRFSKSLSRKTVAGRALWEGPDEASELPVQPSPGTFRFLHGLALEMGRLGGDLWSPTAVSALKQYLRVEIGRRWAATLEEKKGEIKANGVAQNRLLSEEDSPVNGDGDTEESSANRDSQKDDTEPKASTVNVVEGPNEEVLIQSLFDTLLLHGSFETLELSSEDGLLALSKILETRIKLEAASRKRLQQAASEYWKRTSLLFGLLA